MPNSSAALRRWLGMFCLAISTGMMIWGRTFLAPHLGGSRFVLYWVGCALVALAAVVISLADIWCTLRRMQAERRELVRATFERLKAEPSCCSESESSLDSARVAQRLAHDIVAARSDG